MNWHTGTQLIIAFITLAERLASGGRYADGLARSHPWFCSDNGRRSPDRGSQRVRAHRPRPPCHDLVTPTCHPGRCKNAAKRGDVPHTSGIWLRISGESGGGGGGITTPAKTARNSQRSAVHTISRRGLGVSAGEVPKFSTRVAGK